MSRVRFLTFLRKEGQNVGGRGHLEGADILTGRAGVATPKNYKNTIVNNLCYHICIRHQRCVLNVVVVRWKIYF
jgi:hypothetical protein